MNIRELAERRAAAQLHFNALGMANSPTDVEGQLMASARYRLAWDAYQAAERDYNAAINKLSTDQLIALSNGSTPHPV